MMTRDRLFELGKKHLVPQTREEAAAQFVTVAIEYRDWTNKWGDRHGIVRQSARKALRHARRVMVADDWLGEFMRFPRASQAHGLNDWRS